MRDQFPRYRVAQAAAIYSTNRFAAEAMGLTVQGFGQLCKKYDIETPNQRRKRVQAEFATGQEEEIHA